MPTNITLTADETVLYDEGDESEAREMLRPILARARVIAARTGQDVFIQTADGTTIEIVEVATRQSTRRRDGDLPRFDG